MFSFTEGGWQIYLLMPAMVALSTIWLKTSPIKHCSVAPIYSWRFSLKVLDDAQNGGKCLEGDAAIWEIVPDIVPTLSYTIFSPDYHHLVIVLAAFAGGEGIQGGRSWGTAGPPVHETSGSSTKGRTPNIRYFVLKPSIVSIYAFFERLSQGFQRKPSCFLRAFKESHPAFVDLSTKAILLL